MIKKQQNLTDRERNLIAVYSQCQLRMTPRQFYAKWGVSYEEIAFICSRSDSTVRRWFKTGKNRRFPTAVDLRHLAGGVTTPLEARQGKALTHLW